MPIEVPAGVRAIDEEAFHENDYQVMGLAFSMRNELGRLWDEGIYQNELAFRCQQAGLPDVSTEVPIHVSFRSFTKTYYMDLLVAGGAMFELKTASALTEGHRAQAVHYLLLTGLNHGALVNLRPASVEHSFVSTRLTPEKRRQYAVDDAQWRDTDADGLWLRQFLIELFCDWGAFLAADLYVEAVVHFRGGPDSVIQQADIVNGPRTVGAQRFHLLNPTTVFRITTLTHEPASYELHLRRMLNHTRLRTIQWINLNHHAITFKTLTQ